MLFVANQQFILLSSLMDVDHTDVMSVMRCGQYCQSIRTFNKHIIYNLKRGKAPGGQNSYFRVSSISV